VLSGGERTRLAVARMLLRPSNTLLLDEPTNHLDLDSKEGLLDALMDFGGTLIFVSHDRYFVERLATKILEVGSMTALPYPGTYQEFLWHKEHPEGAQASAPSGGQPPRVTAVRRDDPLRVGAARPPRRPGSQPPAPSGSTLSRDERKRLDAAERRKARAEQARRTEIEGLETRISQTEIEIRELEQRMAEPGFYSDRTSAQPVIDRHQALMWQVGDLMHRWEELQTASDLAPTTDA